MTAARSSNSATPKTNSLKLLATFSSENALAMIVVLEMAIMRRRRRFDHGPTEGASDLIAEPHQQSDLDDGDKACGRCEADEFAHAEFQADREHQQNDAELRKVMDAIDIDQQRKREVWADQHPGDQVPHDQWLSERLTKHRNDGGNGQDEGQIFKKIMRRDHRHAQLPRSRVQIERGRVKPLPVRNQRIDPLKERGSRRVQRPA